VFLRRIKLKLKSGTFIRNLIKKCEVELNHVEKTTNETKKKKIKLTKKRNKQQRRLCHYAALNHQRLSA